MLRDRRARAARLLLLVRGQEGVRELVLLVVRGHGGEHALVDAGEGGHASAST